MKLTVDTVAVPCPLSDKQWPPLATPDETISVYRKRASVVVKPIVKEVRDSEALESWGKARIDAASKHHGIRSAVKRAFEIADSPKALKALNDAGVNVTQAELDSVCITLRVQLDRRMVVPSSLFPSTRINPLDVVQSNGMTARQMMYAFMVGQAGAPEVDGDEKDDDDEA